MPDVNRHMVKLFGPTLESTGANAGRACVGLQFGAGESLTVEDIARELRRLDTIRAYRLVVTGEDAATRWTDALAVPLRRAGFRIHLETDGTQVPAGALDWLAITPRKGAAFVDIHTDEVRVIVEGSSDVHQLDHYAARWRCDHYLLQPQHRDDITRCLQLIAARPRWRLSLDLRESVAVPVRLAAPVGAPQQDVQPGAEAETTLLA
jgi:hypothetical protein